eukprot:361311-Chlamydomonas_euryale.AAC.2
MVAIRHGQGHGLAPPLPPLTHPSILPSNSTRLMDAHMNNEGPFFTKHTLTLFTLCTGFSDTMTSTPSAVKSQSLQRSLRHLPGLDLDRQHSPATGLHTRKG